MLPFWKSSISKLIIGGCGAQLGTLSALAFITGLALFCSVCLLVNLVTINLAQEVESPQVVSADIPASADEGTMVLLRERLSLLVSSFNAAQARGSLGPVSTPLPPPPPKPIAMANQGAVNLRSGPGDHYVRLGRLPGGESLEIVGRNSDSSWWLVVMPNGSFAWVSSMVVAAFNVTDTLPVVSIPALLVQPEAAPDPSAASEASASSPVADPALPLLPAGTSTPAANQSRRFVQDTQGYIQLSHHLLLPTVSASFAPDGSQIAITEKIKLYIVTADGQYSQVMLEDNQTIDLVGGLVWSPDGQYLAFTAKQIQGCDPCQSVGLVRLLDGQVTLLKSPPGLGLDLPRWTQDGRLLVIAHKNEPTQGTVYVYDTSGQGQVASGTLVLSSSHDGQKWLPWLPGRTWQVDPAKPVSSYYTD